MEVDAIRQSCEEDKHAFGCTGLLTRRRVMKKSIDYLYGINSREDFPNGEVVVTAERGLKSRIVSKHMEAISHGGHAIRKFLLRGLQRDPRSRQSLKGDHSGAVKLALRSGVRRDSNYLNLSSDLTAASDLIPLDLATAIVEGLMESRPLPPAFRKIFRDLTGP